MGFLLLVSLVVSAGIAALGAWWAPMFGSWEVLATAVNFVVSFALVTALFALLYKFMPRVRIEWHDVWIGAAVTALLFTVGKFAIGLYIGKSGVTSGFGAAGSLVVLLLWVYYSAQIFLLGAEFTAVYARSDGSHRHEVAPASPQPPAAAAKAMTTAQPTPSARSRSPGRIERHPARVLGVAMLAGVASAVAARLIMQKRAANGRAHVAHPASRSRGKGAVSRLLRLGSGLLKLARKPVAARRDRGAAGSSLASPY